MIETPNRVSSNLSASEWEGGRGRSTLPRIPIASPSWTTETQLARKFTLEHFLWHQAAAEVRQVADQELRDTLPDSVSVQAICLRVLRG